MNVTIDNWRLVSTIGSVPAGQGDYHSHARLADEFDLERSGELWFVGAGRASIEWPEVVVCQRFGPGPDSGFCPGALIASDVATLFLGAGIRLLAYNLQTASRLWVDEADTGFGGWRRHGNVVVMSAELELAAWTTEGDKLWTTFVEPPWSYDADDTTLRLEVMGNVTRFDLLRGPTT